MEDGGMVGGGACGAAVPTMMETVAKARRRRNVFNARTQIITVANSAGVGNS